MTVPIHNNAESSISTISLAKNINCKNKNIKKVFAVINCIKQKITSFFCNAKNIYNRTVTKLNYVFIKGSKFINNKFHSLINLIKTTTKYCIESKTFKMILVRMLITLVVYGLFYSF